MPPRRNGVDNAEVDVDEAAAQAQAFLKELMVAVKAKAATETDPLRSFVEEKIGKIPPRISWDRIAVVKSPYLWLLVFDKTFILPSGKRTLKETDFRDEFGGPGRLLAAWTARATAEWCTLENAGVASTQIGRVSRLGSLMQSMASIWFNHPAAKGVEHLIGSLEALLDQAEDLCYDLDETSIHHTVGAKQGAEFKRLRALSSRNFSPRTSEMVARLSFRGGPHEDDDESSKGQNRKRPRNGGGGGGKRVPPAEWNKMSAEQKKTVLDKRKTK